MMRNHSSSSNVARFLVQKSDELADTTAIIQPQSKKRGTVKKYSFFELNQLSDELCHRLIEKGIARGTRTLLMVRPGLELILSCFSLFKIGAVPVVIDPGMGLKSFMNCVVRTEPEALLGIPLAHIVSSIFRKKFKSVKTKVKVDSSFISDLEGKSTSRFSIAETAADELAAILFTSGSTGPAKGVLYEHGQFDSQVSLIRNTFGIEEGEIDLPMLPVFALFNPALGMTTVVPDMNPSKPASVDPVVILDILKDHKVTNSFGSPAIWHKISHYATERQIQLPNMRRLLMAGAPVPPALMRQMKVVFPAAKLYSPYGATECLPVSAIEADTVINQTGENSEAGAGTCVGKPVSGVEVRIIKITEDVLETFSEHDYLPTGEEGEIIATGLTVTKGYDHLPEASRRSKIRDSEGRLWHRMGDVGYLDDSGKLWFCGRVAERVQTVEGDLYTDKIEGIFNAVSGVKRSALIGIGRKGAETPAIVIEPDDWKVRPRLEDMQKGLSEHSPAFKIKQVFYEKSFPVDVRHNAKIHRLTLRKKYNKR